MLATLVRRTVRSGWRLLLLVDEAEELLVVGRGDAGGAGPAAPRPLARARRAHGDHGDAAASRASTRSRRLPTSPFLQGFIPPVYLTPLAPDEGRALARARRLRRPPTSTPCSSAPPATRSWCSCIASRLFESRDLAATLDQLAADEMVANYFSVDFATLEAVERDAARRGGAGGPAARGRAGARRSARPEEDLETPLYGLSMLGYLARDGEAYRLGNWFFERWLRRRVAGDALATA